MGVKTAASVSVIAMTANCTSRVPRMAASRGFMPSSICLKIFSRTTIASSTTSPIAKTSASKVSVLIEKPAAYIKVQAPIRHTGIVTSGMIEARKVPRNTKITKATSATASMMVRNTASRDLSINTVVSFAMRTFRPWGRLCCSFGNSALSAAASTSGLAVACLISPTETAGCALSVTFVRSLKAPIFTLATSPSMIG